MSSVVHRSFLLGRTAGEAVCQERREALSVLVNHNRLRAGVALAQSGAAARKDFEAMRSVMYAGGFHCVRLTGGRSIERRR